ncbi:3-hydroxy-3-methylglutaryl-coenzyme A reductase-like protein [Sarcoptes scabiei]|uniref:3-hydroxy-3-methylglutaryl coenzyme A reductase n=1 Tax=Sarcoptes scabiei TaxID=52283 RepID=A0A132AFG5_SARSC|nr:3-hydroxy-3-methylglutaryl-coenzyme A reductase-like protein [Sarcoptes scabiei]
MARLFYSHGQFCAKHPCEVIVIFLSAAICLGTMGPYILIDNESSSSSPPFHQSHHQHHNDNQLSSHLSSSSSIKCLMSQIESRKSNDWNANNNPKKYTARSCQPNSVSGRSSSISHSLRSEHSPVKNPLDNNNLVDSTEIIILTISRCLALLYMYHQFRNIYNQSKYLIGIAVLFTMFSSIMFISGIMSIFNGNISVLNKAIPFFILLSDLSKSCSLARFALSSSNRHEIQENIARGMATLGPSLTLDTLVETLAIGMGSISGLPRLAEISYFSCLTIVVNYIAFMTLFPATLSLALEIAHDGVSTPVWHFSSLAKVLQLESEYTPNPVIQRVKLIMSAALVLVHTFSRWPQTIDDSTENLMNSFKSSVSHIANDNVSLKSEDNSILTGIINAIGCEQVLMIGLMFAITIKYFWFENLDFHSKNINNSNSDTANYSEPNSNIQNFKNSQLLPTKEECETSSTISSTSCSNTTSTTPSSTRPTTPATTTSDESDNSSRNENSMQSTLGESICTETSDTESVLGQCRHKLSFAKTSSRGTTFSSVKTICIDDPSASSGHGTDYENESSVTPTILSSCDGKSIGPPSSTATFFIGDDSSDCYSSDSNVPELVDATTQTDMLQNISLSSPKVNIDKVEREIFRSESVLLELMKQVNDYSLLSDRELEHLVSKKKIPAYKLETLLGDAERGVSIRRRVIEKLAGRESVLNDVPHNNYNYNLVLGACCENVIGYMPVPLGVAGPLVLNGSQYYVPMATTEGCLVASTNRGCRAIAAAGGCRSKVYFDGMTRGPLLYFRSALDAAAAQEWISQKHNFHIIKNSFDSTSRFARLKSIKASLAGRYLFLRFVASTGDAMGMNMLSKGTELALEELAKHVKGLELKCLSGNFCTDKKPSAVNWIDGRGKSVVCEALIPKEIVENILKTSVDRIVRLGNSKNLIGSSIAGSIGGNNAQAANIVAAIYIATGQDPAQVVGSANCITLLETEKNGDLYISCTMPSIEIGTVGGGTVLGPQGACLRLLGLKKNDAIPGENSRHLAQIVCATVLAGELSLLSALAAGHLVRSHMKHNRSSTIATVNTSPSALLMNSNLR